jgi:hypothetical protein
MRQSVEKLAQDQTGASPVFCKQPDYHAPPSRRNLPQRTTATPRKSNVARQSCAATVGLFSRPKLLRHRVAITCEVGAGGKTSETVSQKILDELPVP